MSIQSQIDRIKANIQGCYTAVSVKGGTVPTTKDTDHLESAIRSIPTGSGGTNWASIYTKSSGTEVKQGGVDSPVQLISVPITAGQLENIDYLRVSFTYNRTGGAVRTPFSFVLKKGAGSRTFTNVETGWYQDASASMLTGTLYPKTCSYTWNGTTLPIKFVSANSSGYFYDFILEEYQG